MLDMKKLREHHLREHPTCTYGDSPHFLPPMFGERGYYLCELAEAEAKGEKLDTRNHGRCRPRSCRPLDSSPEGQPPMSDTRREIAERHAQEWLARWGSAPPNSAIEAAMSEYAAAVLEEEADNHEKRGEVGRVVAAMLRARAAQERESDERAEGEQGALSSCDL